MRQVLVGVGLGAECCLPESDRFGIIQSYGVARACVAPGG